MEDSLLGRATRLPKPTVVYGFDPLCGWCFGFGPAFAEIQRELEGEFDFELACGGLVTGDRVRAVRHDADYLRAGLQQVEERTGVKAGRAFLEGLLAEGNYVSNSVPLIEAIHAATELNGNAAFGFGYGLAVAFYRDGLPPDHPDTVARVAEQHGLDADALMHLWQHPTRRTSTGAWMDEARRSGVTTYPSLFLRPHSHSELLPLTAGAVTSAEAIALIRTAAT